MAKATRTQGHAGNCNEDHMQQKMGQMTTCKKRRANREHEVTNIEQQTPDRQTHTFVHQRKRKPTRMKRRAKRESAMTNLKRRLPERQTHTKRIAYNKTWGQKPTRMKRRAKGGHEVANMEQQTPDRQTHTFFPHRKRFTRATGSIYEVGVEPVAVAPSWVGESTLG